MREQRPARVIPDDHPLYRRVELEGRVDHWIRVPFPTRTAEMLKALGAWGVLSGMSQEDIERKLTEEPGALQRVWSLMGAFIGACWAHPTQAIETDPAALRNGDHAAFGEAVLEELHEAGYKQAEIQRLFSASLEAVMAHQLGVADLGEVTARADFSGRQPAASS